MVDAILKVTAVAVLMLVGWIAYERILWPEDYMKYQAPYLLFGEVDTTYKQHVNPALFQNAKIYTDPIKLYNHEDIAVSNDGTIYTGLEDGSLVKIATSGQINIMHKHNDSGMIAGLIITSDDRTLYYVTEEKGLVKFDLLSQEVTYLLRQIDGKAIPAMNNLCIDEEKQIIFITDCSTFKLRRTGKDLIMKRKSGRIISYNLKTKQTKVILSGLAYPNGIVFDKASQSIIFSELTHHKISRFVVYQDGAKKQVIVDNLFGYPDNLDLNQEGELYVGFPGVRDPNIEQINTQPAKRKYLMYLPEKLLEMLTPKIAGGIKLDPKTGKIKEYIFGSTDQYHSVTTIVEKNGKLYFASLRNPKIIVVDKDSVHRAQGNNTQEADL